MIRSDVILWTLAALLLSTTTGVAILKGGAGSSPSPLQRMAPDPDCDLRRGACTSRLPGGARVRFAIEPRGIPVLRPLQLSVGVEGLPAERVSVGFRGVDMDMGLNRSRLQAEGPGEFRGEGLLPVCVRERMTWEAEVHIEAGGRLLAVPFRFDTVRPGSTSPSGE